jgi:mono/diheme cytochrome c family protein
MRGFIAGFVVCLLVLVVGAIGYSYSGLQDVAAAAPENPALGWLLHNTFAHSARSAAASVTVPANFETADAVRQGAKLYNNECVYCHGSPGDEPTGLAKGLNPQPPQLLAAGRIDNPAYIFWVAKNGVQMTAMPAWGKSYDDQHLWTVVAFLHQKKGLNADEYKALTGD